MDLLFAFAIVSIPFLTVFALCLNFIAFRIYVKRLKIYHPEYGVTRKSTNLREWIKEFNRQNEVYLRNPALFTEEPLIHTARQLRVAFYAVVLCILCMFVLNGFL